LQQHRNIGVHQGGYRRDIAVPQANEVAKPSPVKNP